MDITTREYIEQMLKHFDRRLDDRFFTVCEKLDAQSKNLCEKIDDVKKVNIQHDKRIVKLEISDARDTAQKGFFMGIVNFLGLLLIGLLNIIKGG